MQGLPRRLVHPPHLVLRPVVQQALADDVADHVHGNRYARCAQPAPRHVVEANAPHVVVTLDPLPPFGPEVRDFLSSLMAFSNAALEPPFC